MCAPKENRPASASSDARGASSPPSLRAPSDRSALVEIGERGPGNRGALRVKMTQIDRETSDERSSSECSTFC